jgi:hypothetical protein
VGTFSLYFNNAGVDGCILNRFDEFGTFQGSRNLSSNLVNNLVEGARFQLVVPDNLPTGMISAGSGSLTVTGSAVTMTWVPLSLDVRAAPSGGGTSTSSDGGGGGGCGAGTAGLGLILLGLGFPLLRRKRSP